MAIDNFKDWREELIFTGKIVQDDDPPDLLEKAEELSLRYIELVEMAKGVYERRVFQALIDSLQVDEDYEIYEATVGGLFSFPAEQFGQWLVELLPSLIVRQPDRAGDFLSLMINNYKVGDIRLLEFKKALRNSSEPTKSIIHDFILVQENDGWLDEKRGWYDDS